MCYLAYTACNLRTSQPIRHRSMVSCMSSLYKQSIQVALLSQRGRAMLRVCQ